MQVHILICYKYDYSELIYEKKGYKNIRRHPKNLQIEVTEVARTRRWMPSLCCSNNKVIPSGFFSFLASRASARTLLIFYYPAGRLKQPQLAGHFQREHYQQPRKQHACSSCHRQLRTTRLHPAHELMVLQSST